MQISAKRLIDARQALAMSQEEVAIATALSSRTIQRIEAGYPASLESTKALLAVFGEEVLADPAAIAPPSAAALLLQLGELAAKRLRIIASYGFDGARLFLAALLMMLALAKPFQPGNIGFFIDKDAASMGWHSVPVANGEDILGLWIIPLMILLSLACAFSIRRLRGSLSQGGEKA